MKGLIFVKKLFIFLIGMSVCFMVIFFVALKEKSDPATVPKSSTPDPMYVVKDNSGILAVYKYNENEPYEVTEIRIDSLPDYDKESLQRGIYVYSDSQLQRLLEDFD